MNTKIIFSPKIAGILMRQGFQPIEERPDYKNPRYWVYLFEATPELEKAFQEITSSSH